MIELAADFDREALDLLCDAPQLTLTKASELFLLAEQHLLHKRERRVVALEAARAGLDRREQSLDLRQAQLEAKEKDVVRERIQISDERRSLMDAEQLLDREIYSQWSAMARVQTWSPFTTKGTQTDVQTDCPTKETQTDEATTHKATQTDENFGVNPEGKSRRVRFELSESEQQPLAASSAARLDPPAKRPAESALEPLGRGEIPNLARKRAREYLKTMGASQYGSPQELRDRLIGLFDANGIDTGPDDGTVKNYYHPGETLVKVAFLS